MLEAPMDTIELDDRMETAIEKPAIESFLYQELSTVKLQELYDLLALKQEHPEFKESIETQLENYTNDTMAAINKPEKESLIKNIELKGNLIEVSDSVQKMKLYYDVVSNNLIQKDSIWAEVTTHEIEVNGKKVKSKKIKFSAN